MSDLPRGTVTFLFSDIEGSTRLLHQLGPDYAAALGDHQALLRAAWAEHGGHEVGTQGDSFFVVFARAGDAVAAAAAAQRALAAHPWSAGAAIRARMGLHTGAPLLTAGGYVGLDVHRAARIAAAGHGGQVLLSQATRDLALAEPLPNASLRDLGEHRLKDLQVPERVYQLTLADLPTDFPPLRTLDRVRHNLPVQLTPLVGRETAVREVCALIERDDVHLVTLAGPGGVGKTRLALQVAAEEADRFADGVYLVALGPVTDPGLVAPTIAQALGLREAGSVTPEDTLRGYLADRHVLLVLDNFEQVVGAGPSLAALLAACRGLKALVTSRIALHLRGEREYPVLPLALPARRSTRAAGPRATLADLEALTQYAAVALFIERARAVKPEFEVTAASAPAIAEICARLDGLPLAIELAAARVRLLPPQALLSRLSNRLKLLTGGALDLPERQQTLRGAIAWSHDLLTPDERVLFRRLAVFAGGCTLEAAETVCVAPEGALPLALDPLDGLDSLAAKSLLRQAEGSETADEPRFRMLETIREFGLEQLEAVEASGGRPPEAMALRRAHLNFALDLAERADPRLRGPDATIWLERLEREHDNFRAALGWARERGRTGGEATRGLRLAAALAYFWFSRGYLSEGREWLEGMIELFDGAETLGQAGVPEVMLARALYGAGDLAVWQGDYARAKARLERSVALARAGGDLGVASDALNRMGIAEHLPGDTARATTYWAESLTLARELGDPWRMAGPLNNLGESAYFEGDLDQAEACYEEALALARRAGDDSRIYVMIGNLGNVARRQGKLDRARTLARAAIEQAHGSGDPRAIAETLEMAAMIAGGMGNGERAARLLGAASALRDAVGALEPPAERDEVAAAVSPARAAMGASAWAAANVAGRALTPDEAVQEALAAD